MIDAHSPGVTVQPIKDMRGDTPFAEVFFDDVRVPVANRVGEENRGWYVAMSTLNFERSGIGSTVRYEQALGRLIDALGAGESSPYLRSDWRGAVRDEVAQRYIETRVLCNLALYNASLQATGEAPTFSASINQLFSAELHQRLARTGAKAFGAYDSIWSHDVEAPWEAQFSRDRVDSLAHTFLAGSSEIQRNVIAVRGLELPRG